MTVVPLDRLPPLDAPDDAAGPGVDASTNAGPGTFGDALAGALDAAGGAFARAGAAEAAFAARRGGLAEMVLERARADVMLSLATAAASRTTQSLSTILGMQV
jgi:flagellar hook-basal body complex protein FliE